MADLYGVSTGGGLTGAGATVDNNARKVPATATWLHNSSYIWVGITGADYDWVANYKNSNSAFFQMLQIVSNHISVVMVNDPALDGSDSTLLIAVNGKDLDATIAGRIEAALDAAFTGSTHSLAYPMIATNTANGWAT